MRKFTTLICFILFVSSLSAQSRMTDGMQKAAFSMALIENYYVDDVDDGKLAEDAIKAMLEKLDPHSTYLSAEEVREMSEPLEGNFEGIGISFNMLSDTLYVIETIAGGPSEKIGLKAGDKIIYVNDSLIAGVKRTTKFVMSQLKGPKGTTVNVKVLRKGVSDLLDFKIIRDKIPVYSVDAAYMVDKNTGYIRVARFGTTTPKEFRDAILKLKGEGMKNLIVDLEYNGGGYLEPAIDLSDEFLDKNKLVVYTEGRKYPRKDYTSTTKGLLKEGKLVVMINEHSASASEIFAGAMQDWDRGVIVGRRSFGKGLVQKPLQLPDNSMIRLTVTRYYTPTGRSIQKPYTNGDLESYNLDVIERYNKGEMMHADSVHFPDSLKYTTLVNHRTVYGGGGIMPDYFIPVDTSKYTPYFKQIAIRGIINKVAYKEVDDHRNDILSKYPNKEDFYKKYTASEELLKKVVDAANEEKIPYNEEEYDISKDVISYQLKAYLGRDVYDMEAFVRILNDDSESFKKAYEIIKDDKMYNDLLNRK